MEPGRRDGLNAKQDGKKGSSGDQHGEQRCLCISAGEGADGFREDGGSGRQSAGQQEAGSVPLYGQQRLETGGSVEETDASVYTYAYIDADGAMKKLSPQGNTGALFDSVTFLNLVEGQLDRDTKLTIDVDVLAIQTEDLGVSSGVPADVLKLIKTQNS